MRLPSRRRLLAGLAAALAAAGVAWALWPRASEPARPGASRGEPLGGLPRSQFYLERDRFLPANHPRVLPGARAGFLRDDDEVFGVVLGGQARAYAVSLLAYHHVVNDVVRGIPVAVTY